MAKKNFHTILLPSRPQIDTITAIFILKRFGGEKLPGIEGATYELRSALLEGEDEESLEREGVIALDIGGGKFDHHKREPQTTACNLVAEYLGQKGNPALGRLLKFIERDDFYGKGIISTDQIDRAFGLPGLVGSLNKKYKDEPQRVIEIVLPLIDAYYTEEEKRFFLMPKELEEKLKSGKANVFDISQRGQKLHGIFIETDDVSMAGFLRSGLGGNHDVVAIRLSTGHVNILTLQKRKIDLRALTVLIRIQEAEIDGRELGSDPEELARTGTIREVPEWYYDPATNSLLNGGPSPKGVNPTKIPAFEFPKIMELGLSERLWAPSR